MRARSLASAVALLTIGAVTACDPVPPAPTFQVDSFLAGADADPGDGSCETAVGTCTVQAAVEEADALGRGVVLVPGSDTTSYGGFDATITGQVTVRAQQSGSADNVTLDSGVITVDGGAGLVLEAIDLNGTLVVDGGVVATRLAVRAVQVGPAGAAVLTNALLLPSGEPALVNEGHAVLRYSTVALWSGAAGLVTLGAGQTDIGATAVVASAGDPTPVTCFGTAPVSSGHNAVTDTACGLTGPGDLQGVDPLPDYEPFPAGDSVLVDAVPVGTLGCGAEVTTDARGLYGPRPVDGDDDGTAACDIGAYEIAAPPV